MSSLELGLIGNGTIGCLLNARAEIVWGCFPRFDADPAFCSLLLDEAHVALVTGDAFGAPGYVRLSFAASMKTLETGFDRIRKFLNGETIS